MGTVESRKPRTWRGNSGFVPTPWAVAVSRWASGFWLTDKEPIRQVGREEGLWRHVPSVQHLLIAFVDAHTTPDAARLSLAYALGKFVRQHQ